VADKSPGTPVPKVLVKIPADYWDMPEEDRLAAASSIAEQIRAGTA
jgi:hypothetical protein